MALTAIALYQPVWSRGGVRAAAADEDVVTMAVAAAAPLVAADRDAVRRLVVVCPDPDVTLGWGSGVVAHALGLDGSAAVELRVGGAPETVDALLGAGPGTIVVGVDNGAAAAAAAARIDDVDGLELQLARRANGSLPMQVRRIPGGEPAVYEDARVERDMVVTPLTERLLDGEPGVVVGAPRGVGAKIGGRDATTPTDGAAAVLFALADVAAAVGVGPADGATRLVAVGAGTGLAVDASMTAPVAVHHLERPTQPVELAPQLRGRQADIPFSMPAYVRAFEAKVGLIAAVCSCGEVSYPPREVCLSCGAFADTKPRPLAHTGEVYTVVPIHVPIPGIPGPYALAIVAIDDSPVRLLAQVADVAATDVAIGDHGSLVLRRLAVREGVIDYGYAFQPDRSAHERVVS